jgi:hypothetical protein
MKFDLTELDRGRPMREMRRSQLQQGVVRRSAGSRTRRKVDAPMPRRRPNGPGARPPIEADENAVPEFNVTVVLTRQPRGTYTAELVWTIGQATGRFPVVEGDSENHVVRKDSPPRKFKREDEARRVAVRQGEDLVNEFIDWALQP